MSKPKRQSLTCGCGHTFTADVYRSANVTAEPNLKDQILAGEFNQVSCPACGQLVDAAVPFLYHDQTARQMIWVYPAASAERADDIREKVRKSYQIVGTVVPDEPESERREVVFGVAELISLLGDDDPT